MTNVLRSSTRLLFSLFLMLVTSIAYSQNPDSGSEKATPGTLEELIEKKSFVFKPQSVKPMKAGSRQLNAGYTFKVQGDTLVCYLPYFGRVYQSAGATDTGLDFTSYRFDYHVKIRKKGGWDISIKTKDLRSQQQFSFTVFENGSASLNVISSDRESISYQGRVEAKEN